MTESEIQDVKPIVKLAEKFAIACAILSVLAENRIIAIDLFKCLPKDSLEDFEKNAMTVLKYLEHMER